MSSETADGLAGLRALAEAVGGYGDWYEAEDLAGRCMTRKDAAFVAAFDPPTVLALISAVEAVRGLLDSPWRIPIGGNPNAVALAIEPTAVRDILAVLDAALAPLDGAP